MRSCKKMADNASVNDESREDDLRIIKDSSSSKNYCRRKSDVWEFFSKKDKSALCKICNKEYAYHGGTSNLRDHLMCLHPSKLPSPSNQPLLDSFLKQSKCSDYRAKKITEHIVDMFVCDLRPATTVEGSGFKALINYIEPGYRVPSANHITEVARRKYLSGKNAINSYLQRHTTWRSQPTSGLAVQMMHTFHLPCILLMIVGTWFQLFWLQLHFQSTTLQPISSAK